jgi:tyrosine-protein kinase Etk/Wzc
MRAHSGIMEDLYVDRSDSGGGDGGANVTGRGTSETTLIKAIIHIAQRRWLVAKVTGITIVFGLIACCSLPVRYTAVTKIMPPQQAQPAAALWMNQLASSGAGGALTAAAAKQLGGKSQNEIYLGLLNSRPIADALIQEFGLMKQYRARDMTGARATLAQFTKVASEKNGFISLAVTDGNKHRAPEIANAYTEQLRILLKTLAVTEASQRRLFYEEQLKQAKEALASAESDLERVEQQKGLIQLDAQAKAMIEGLATMRAQAAAKQVELEAIRSYSTDRNPEVQLAEQELASLERGMARLEQRSRSSSATELGLEDVPGAGLEYLRAEHEVKYRQTMFDLFMKQLDAARLDEAQEAAIIQVVEPAIEPDRMSSPNRLQILVLFTLGGLLAGCLMALGLWWKHELESDPDRSSGLRQLRSAFAGKKT